jgi:hypothetical protein
VKNDRRTFDEYRVQFADGSEDRVHAYDRIEAENEAIFSRQSGGRCGSAVECVGVVRVAEEAGKDACRTGGAWMVTKQRYHGELEPAPCFLVHQFGKSRGICTCWTDEQSQGLAALMNANGFRDPLDGGAAC